MSAPSSISGAPEAPARSPGQEAVDAFLSMVGVLRRRWLYVVLFVIVGVAVAAGTISLLTPRWRATATIVVNAAGPQVLDDIKGVSDEEGGAGTYKQYYETQRAIIGSRRVAAAALYELGLADDPVFLGIDKITSEEERSKRRKEIDAVERLREMVTVQEVRESRVVKISAEYPDAETARDIANAVANAYVDFVTRNRTDTTSQAGTALATERSAALAEVRAAAKELDDFKQLHEITSISLEDRQSIVTQNILTLSARAKEAQAQRISLSATWEQAKNLHSTDTLSSAGMLPAGERVLLDSLILARVDAERDLAAVASEHGELWPDVVRAKARLNSVSDKVESQAAALLAVMKARSAAARRTEIELNGALESERQRALELARLEPEFRDMTRRLAEAEREYERISTRRSEVGMTQRVEPNPPIEILDEATTPSRASFPNKVLILAVGLMLGLVLGGVVALAVDLRDLRVRSTADIERALAGLGIPLLSQLPVLPADPRLGTANLRAQRRQRDLHTHLFPQSLMAERCRVLRTAVTFALSAERGRPSTLMVTSPTSGEGKSSIALNLAISFCQVGKKVVLVDADMRRPRLHQVFDVPVGREAFGLSGVLDGSQSLDEALLRGLADMPETMSVLPCGQLPDDPAERLEGPAFRALLGQLRERFDLIIFDSPPVLPVTDPLIIAREVDGVIAVARCSVTHRGELVAALGELRRSETNILGAVLNVVDPREDSRGYSASSYYYEYRARPEASSAAGHG